MQAISIMHWKFLQASIFGNIFLVLELVASNSKSEFPIWVGDLTINNAREQWEQWEPGLGAERGHSVLRICPHWWTIKVYHFVYIHCSHIHNIYLMTNIKISLFLPMFYSARIQQHRALEKKDFILIPFTIFPHTLFCQIFSLNQHSNAGLCSLLTSADLPLV